MDIQVPGQERSHLKSKQTRKLRHNPAIEEEEDEDYDEVFGSTSVESSSEEDSRDSSSCSSGLSSSDVAEDCASSSSSPSSRSSSSMALSSNGPLYDLSRLMSQLPIKRGLSKFYEGKSQSFTSLANVECIKDLPKKGWYNGSHGMRMKSSKSFVGLFEQSNKRAYSPKATITKKSTRLASAMSSLSRRAALLEACRLSTPATGEEDILLLSQNPSLQPSCTQYIPM